MHLDFDNPKHEALVNSYETLCRRYNRKGQDIATEIIAVVDVLFAAETLFDVPRAYRPHPLKAEYKGCFAVDVTKTHRLIFKPNNDGDPNFRIDNYKTITAISIIEIFIDYH